MSIESLRFLKEDVAKVPCVIRYRLKGKMIIEGQTFNQIMPAIQQLKPDQMEHIIRFMQRTWDYPPTALNVKS